ncbi:MULTISPECIES: hypothetical protein [unclassified Caulobacter]|uniref:hypothetical protein n=1 Tax=unclassified Caulobacter TaxID=2648921 RepID=UPI000D3940CF|nr:MULTISPECIES: hypothetical protein [unclassified Caulobacter]PTS87658.1 hypothetical protein DBR21_12015 [Caulobacter sp. HMWF009]PTT13187.1 hypothetical protein DBR10_00255 [Caulobacter sp. HMWF025]
MRRLVLLTVPAVLMLAGCGPGRAEQAQICAILAQPGVPGIDRIGDGEALAPVDRQLQAKGRIYGPGLRLGQIRSWGSCPNYAPTVEMLLLDGNHAVTKGGVRANGAQKTFGTCFYVRTETRWRLLACRINGAS